MSKKHTQTQPDPLTGECVYVLLLEGGYYYVGYSESGHERRVEWHLRGNGAEWTKLHKPVKLVEVIQGGDAIVELTTTLNYMKVHGWQKVRGGRYSAIVLLEPPMELEKGKGSCYICRQRGHFAKECPKGKAPAKSALYCQRCGRNSHSIVTCFAKTHFDGNPLSPDKEEVDKGEEQDQDKIIRDKCIRENPLYEEPANPDHDFEQVPLSGGKGSDDESDIEGDDEEEQGGTFSGSSGSPTSGSDDWGCVIM